MSRQLEVAVGSEAGDPAGIGASITERGHFICNETRTHLFLAGISGSCRSLAVFPLTVGGKLAGALTFCAAEPAFFDAKTGNLLNQIASTLSLGLEAIELGVRRRNAEEQLRNLNEELERRVAERTEQLAAANMELAVRNREVERADHLKSEFLTSMSHELRTPLHAIVGFSDLMAEERAGPLQPKQKRFLEHIRTGAQHLLQLINDILDISRIEAGRISLNPEEFRADEAAIEVLSVVSPLAGSKQIRVQCRIGTQLRIRADRIRFKQILYNLLSNAVKFTPENGEVRIDSREEETGGTCFSVSDTGMGIPPEEQPAIFDEFHQVGHVAKAEAQGSGLGLAITQRLVRLHRGRIWLESEPGKGSTFFFTIPAAAARNVTSAQASPDAAQKGVPDAAVNPGRTT